MNVAAPEILLLDTDILSAIMRNDALASDNARNYLARQARFTFSVITRYEVLRGLKAKKAERQAEAFGRFCTMSEILPVTDEVVVKGAEIYAALRSRRDLVGDADILIAATALVNGAGLVTNNEGHFNRIEDLYIENWLR